MSADTSISEAITTPALIAAASGRWPDNELVVFDSDRLSYADADRRAAVLAQQLLLNGAGKGSHVGILLPNSCEFVISFLAITRIGAVAIPLSTFSTAAELTQLICHADLHSLIFQPGYLKHNYIETLQSALPSLRAGSDQFLPEAPFLRRLWIWADAAPDWATSIETTGAAAPNSKLLTAAETAVHAGDAAAIIYTSGSTGEPKGVVHSHASLLRQSIKQAREKGYTASDRIFSSMPFFWVGGLSYKLLPAMQTGATVTGCQSAASSDILDFIERENISWFLGWPHAGQALEADPSFGERKLTAMRGGYLFGALPPGQRPADLESIGNALGMTETAGPHTAGHLSPLPDSLRGSFGYAAPGIEYRVVDWETGRDAGEDEAGELWVRGDTLMLGLYKRERAEVFTEDGWYRSRDLVSQRQGHLFFHGRLDDVVKIKGANVSPKEVEEIIVAQPDVVQAVVTGVSHNGKLQLGAVLVTGTECEIDVDGLKAALREKLSSYKVPTVYTVLPAAQLPFRSSGKVDRLALIARLQQALEA